MHRPPPLNFALLAAFAAARATRRNELLSALETMTMRDDPKDPIDNPKKPSDFVNDPVADPVDQVELEVEDDEDGDDATGFEDDEEEE